MSKLHSVILKLSNIVVQDYDYDNIIVYYIDFDFMYWFYVHLFPFTHTKP